MLFTAVKSLNVFVKLETSIIFSIILRL
jgi:hypothetical protein